MSPFCNLHRSSQILTNLSNHITHLTVSSLGIRITCVQFCHLVQMNSIPTQKSFLNRLTHSDDGFRFRSTRVSISTLHAAESAHNVLERAQNVHHAKCSTTDLLAYLCLPDAALSLSLCLPRALRPGSSTLEPRATFSQRDGHGLHLRQSKQLHVNVRWLFRVHDK